MSVSSTSISWCDSVWNPIRGCTIKSLGCQHCYAMAQAGRFSGTGQPYEGLVRKTSQGFRWTGDVRLIEKDLAVPLRWKKPRRIFVTSMSDLFHENVEDEWLDRIFAVMALAPRHTFQVLTKRPERMYAYFHPGKCASSWRDNLALAAFNLFGQEAECAVANAIEGCLADGFNVGWPLSNLWLGVSVENQATADERIPWLLKTPAAVRFVSCKRPLGLKPSGFAFQFPRCIARAEASIRPAYSAGWRTIQKLSDPSSRYTEVHRRVYAFN